MPKKVRRIKVEGPAQLSAHFPLIQSTLKSGGLIAFPTDTFYGLGADPFQEKAIQKVFQLKKRSAGKPLIVLASNREQIAKLAEDISENAEILMKRFWPGPLTLALKAKDTLSTLLTAGGKTLGVRIPGNSLTCALLEGVGPLTAPSANPSDEKAPASADEVANYFGEELDLIIDGGETPGDKSSTLLDMTTHSPVLLREGAVSIADLELVLGVPLHKTLDIKQ
ncbi:MAG: threonylcarbamoyl-AMP synthase [Nitrospinae bacterium CG11_big_fil_rev_8_21_14_0_20_45_15]|nr:MAG: threonylcarbamoyl-AMP synthase [Nitrospinae bacterium CG11_big_fil_rev_8_21_14_0_20_45_15]